mgnify:CR=1 FL=1
MKLTPIDILQHQFTTRLRGYDKEEVTAFLQGVAEELGELIKENAQKEERLSRIEEELALHQEREGELRNTLVMAQKLTEELKENAKRDAELIIKEAEHRAQRLLDQAHQRLAHIQAEIADLQRQKLLFEARLRSAIHAHLDLLQSEAEKERKASIKPQAPPGKE